MINENEGWILAGNWLLLRYHNGEWQEVIPPPEYGHYTAMGMLNGKQGWLMGSQHILHYQDGEWEVFDNPALIGMAKIQMLNENEGWAVGQGILHYTNK